MREFLEQKENMPSAAVILSKTDEKTELKQESKRSTASDQKEDSDVVVKEKEITVTTVDRIANLEKDFPQSPKALRQMEELIALLPKTENSADSKSSETSVQQKEQNFHLLKGLVYFYCSRRENTNTTRNSETATTHLRQAASLGSAAALRLLGVMCRDENPKESLRNLMHAAIKGDAQALGDLGLYTFQKLEDFYGALDTRYPYQFFSTDPVKKQILQIKAKLYQEPLFFLKAALEKGCFSQMHLAYLEKIATITNTTVAKLLAPITIEQCLQKAIGLGSTSAAQQLGDCYYCGSHGVKSSNTSARSLYSVIAEHGDIAGIYALAQCLYNWGYEDATRVERNAEAAKYFRKFLEHPLRTNWPVETLKHAEILLGNLSKTDSKEAYFHYAMVFGHAKDAPLDKIADYLDGFARLENGVNREKMFGLLSPAKRQQIIDKWSSNELTRLLIPEKYLAVAAADNDDLNAIPLTASLLGSKPKMA